MILFTDKISTPPIYKSLSSTFKDKIAFGEIRDGNVGVASQFNITKYPTILAICNGDVDAQITYDGPLKPAKIRRFLDEFAGGKKCARAIKLDASTDFSKLSVAQMRAFLSDQGETCRGCAEKHEFVEKVKSLILSTV